MKKIVIVFSVLFFVTGTKAQSFLDDQFLYLYLGKRANEFAYSSSLPYNSYGYARTLLNSPFSGMQLNDNFVYPDFTLNGKGSMSKFSNDLSSKKIYSVIASDGSWVNGGIFAKGWYSAGVTHNISLDGVHRYKTGTMDQPGKNDLNGRFGYRLSVKKSSIEVGVARLSEKTQVKNTGREDDSLFRFDNRYSMTQVYLRSVFYFNEGKSDRKRLQSIVVHGESIWLQHQAKLSVHTFDSDQRALSGKIRYRNMARNGIGPEFSLGAEYLHNKTVEHFDSVSTVPLANVLSAYADASHQFNRQMKMDVLYRAEILTATGQCLHNPGLRLSVGTISKGNAFVYTQLLHRYVNVIPEYMAYLSTQKAIYRNPVIVPDEFIRSGINTSYPFNDRLILAVSYHYDFYTLRNVADVSTQNNVINFYRVHHAAADHVAEGKLIWGGRKLDARLMVQYTASVIKKNGHFEALPFYSPVSLLSSISYRDRDERYSPEANVSAFYSAPFIIGTDAEQNNIRSKAGFSLNARFSFPFVWLRDRMEKPIPHLIKRITLVAGCENITNHKQNNLYNYAGDAYAFNGTNTWGQYFGRRWFFGFSFNLNKNYYSS